MLKIGRETNNELQSKEGAFRVGTPGRGRHGRGRSSHARTLRRWQAIEYSAARRLGARDGARDRQATWIGLGSRQKGDRMRVLHVKVERDDGWLVAQGLEEPEVITQANTLDELITNIRDAAELLLEERDIH